MFSLWWNGNCKYKMQFWNDYVITCGKYPVDIVSRCSLKWNESPTIIVELSWLCIQFIKYLFISLVTLTLCSSYENDSTISSNEYLGFDLVFLAFLDKP